jgi:hypothetical protein
MLIKYKKPSKETAQYEGITYRKGESTCKLYI